jgi:hypothetical protein
MTRGRGTLAEPGPRALVLGVEHPRGVAVVRSLGRRGIRVVGVERDANARGLGSRYLQQIVAPRSPASPSAASAASNRYGTSASTSVR